MPSPEEVRKQLQEMAQLTIFSGRLNELQQKNMEMYPFVYFNGVKSVKINYDLLQIKPSEEGPVSNNSTVSYYLTIDESQPNAHMDNRFLALESSVRTLLWDSIKVSIYLNDIKAYEGTDERREQA